MWEQQIQFLAVKSSHLWLTGPGVRTDLFSTLYSSVLFEFFSPWTCISFIKEKSFLYHFAVFLLPLILFFFLLCFHFEEFSQRITQFIKKVQRQQNNKKIFLKIRTLHFGLYCLLLLFFFNFLFIYVLIFFNSRFNLIIETK